MTIGKRIMSLRSELGLSQTDLAKAAGYDQARISRVETGEIPPSVDMIDRLAPALGRTGKDLVAGTDREAYYVAQTLTPEARANCAVLAEILARLTPAMDAFLLSLFYQRVYDLFEALYGGAVAPRVTGVEQTYIALMERCAKLLASIEQRAPGITERVYFPDHVEIADDMDMLIDDWHYGERGSVKASQREIMKVLSEHERIIAEHGKEWTEWALNDLNLREIDAAISSLRALRENLDRRFEKVYCAKSEHDIFPGVE